MAATVPLSLRLPATVEEEVRRLAAIEHRTLADVARRLIEEALTMRAHPDVTFADGPTGRRAVLINGPDVWEVVEPYLLANKDWEALRASYPDLDESVLRAAVRYYEAYPDEIEARIHRNAPRRASLAGLATPRREPSLPPRRGRAPRRRARAPATGR